jgi:hypothetical protein
MKEKRMYRMRIRDKNDMWWTVTSGTESAPFYSGPPRGEEAPIEKYLFQCESLDGQSTTIGAPFSIKYYERGHKDKLVELLEKKLLEESQQSNP